MYLFTVSRRRHWKSLKSDHDRKKRLEQDALQRQEKEEKKKTITVEQKITIPKFITVKNFSDKLQLPVSQVIAELMKNGITASLNERIDFETAAIVAEDLGAEVELLESEEQRNAEESGEKLAGLLAEKNKKELKSRPPVVVIMGHVDHGKTKLLDAIRRTNVVDAEAGGITQHIGAYQVVRKKHLISFIDTPGHEAFTAMRSRGAKIADIAILIVAADDGVMPQTEEAYQIIKNAKLPVIVAINKIDKPDANVEKTKQELTNKLGLVPEEWGGKDPFVEISAKKEMGIDDLLEVILLVTEMEKDNIVANYNKSAVGTIIESHVDKGEGPVATMLVQRGVLNVEDYLAIGNVLYGKVRAMKTWKGESVSEAPPSMPVKILGFKKAPQVGDAVEVKKDTKGLGKRIKTYKSADQPEPDQAQLGGEKEDSMQKLNIILKSDVLGSAEAIEESVLKVEHPDVKANIIGKGLGNVTEADVLRAEASNALVLGFNVQAPPNVEELAYDKKVEIKTFQIIYELIDEVKKRLNDLLSPEIVKVDLGKLEVLAIFRSEPKSMIVGGQVKSGKLENNAKVVVLRDDKPVAEGKITQLQCNKRDTDQVKSGQECGLKYEGRPVVEEGDVLEVYKEEQRARKLE